MTWRTYSELGCSRQWSNELENSINERTWTQLFLFAFLFKSGLVVFFSLFVCLLTANYVQYILEFIIIIIIIKQFVKKKLRREKKDESIT